MRMWHYLQIPYLPNLQLLGQWRECCAIAQEWANEGYISHPLVRPAAFGSYVEMTVYCLMVKNEMNARGYFPREYTIVKLRDNLYKISTYELGEGCDRKVLDDIWDGKIVIKDIYPNWHNQTYFQICWWNMYEKYLCGSISDTEWARYLEGGREFV